MPDDTQHPQQTDIHALVGFEPPVSGGERPQTQALDRAATGTGNSSVGTANTYTEIVAVVAQFHLLNL